MLIKPWKQGFAAGILLLGADAAYSQSPGSPFPVPQTAANIQTPSCVTPAVVTCQPPSVAIRPTFCDRVRSWFGQFEAPDSVPLGQSVASHFDGHIMAGNAARMVFHDYDFVPDSDKLNYRGLAQVKKVANLMGISQTPVIIEETPRDPRLAERRRLTVLVAMARVEPTTSPTRVVVGGAVAFPHRGSEAELIQQNFLHQTMNRGTLPSTGTGGSGSSGSSTGSTGTASPSPTGR